ncbi:hypothetical protein LP52_09970 [Streptomonospora alba]|uniref:Uncharacterized protein n=1 Tax=Streptomonospora alba TaxID=183763 RepID=A0A0C2JQA3_9ACTN|nr:hypothetical protein [Streptomonospora alba]KIH99002.1 hypothetical protein LP52_09970 [Streptomonospora alba]
MSHATVPAIASVEAEFAAITARLDPFSEPDTEQETKSAPDSAPAEKEADLPEKETEEEER